MNFIEKMKELKEAQSAKATVRTVAENNPNRARIEAKLQALKAALQTK